MLSNTILLFLTILPLIRHTYVTAAINSSSNNNSDNAVQLLNDVIQTFDYRVRPVLNQSQPIQVHVTYHLLNLIKIDEINQHITINIWVNFSWWDEVRTWNPEDYGGNDVVHPSPEDLWRPKTVLTNSVIERDVFKDNDSPVSIYSSGATRWYAGGAYNFVCGMDLTYFPFDEQTCTASVMSTNLGREIEFVPTSPEMTMGEYVVNGEWEVKSSRVTTRAFSTSAEESLAFLYVSVTFRRRPMFYIVNIMIPIMCLSVLSLFGFVIPKDSGERASFGVTVLLALAVYFGSISDQLPANSDSSPLLCLYIFNLLCLSMLSVLIIVCQLRVTAASSSSSCFSSSSSSPGCHDNDYTKTINNNNDDDDNGADFETGNARNKISHISSRQPSLVASQDRSKNSENNHSSRMTNDDMDAYRYKAGLKSLWRTTPTLSKTSKMFPEGIKKLVLESVDSILFTLFAILWVEGQIPELGQACEVVNHAMTCLERCMSFIVDNPAMGRALVGVLDYVCAEENRQEITEILGHECFRDGSIERNFESESEDCVERQLSSQVDSAIQRAFSRGQYDVQAIMCPLVGDVMDCIDEKVEEICDESVVPFVNEIFTIVLREMLSEELPTCFEQVNATHSVMKRAVSYLKMLRK